MAKLKTNYSILIVEDEDKIAKILTTYLGLYPKFTKIVRARDGVEAMQKISNQEFDLIITDLVLPKRDGITLIDSIRKVPKYYNQKIMVVSGCLTPDLTLRCVKRNVKHIIVKPFTARQLLLKSVGFLKAEKSTRKTVDTLLEKMARRYLLKVTDDGKPSISDEMKDFVSSVIEDSRKKF